MKNIEFFIEDFRTRQNNYIENSEEAIRHQFMSGYCYYFAKILEIVYPGGKVCLCFPYGHFVYQYNDKIYDIEGESSSEYEHLIPECFLGKSLGDFLHNGTDNNTSTIELACILQKYLESK